MMNPHRERSTARRSVSENGSQAVDFEDYHAIEKLVNRYADCADKGDFEGIARHYAFCTIYMPGGQVIDVAKEGVDRYVQWYRERVRLYPDTGTPKTRRLMGTIIIDDDGPNCAKAQSYVVCFQATTDLPLQAIIAGTLHDRFQKIDGSWQIVERREDLELMGDVTHHVYALMHAAGFPR
jgi:hypothetical protein